jgi:general secretion pathway protein D
MNSLKTIGLSSLFLGMLIRSMAQTAEDAAAGGQAPAPTAPPAAREAAPAGDPQRDSAAPPSGSSSSATGAKELRLNFRNAPLESVLNYLSDAAGFIIVPRTGSELKGKVTVWSNQPVSREEALDLLNSALDQNGYAAVRNGRTLTIWNKEDAKKQDLPVKSGNKPEEIPKNDEMVTQIIPVRFISAVQVSRDLQPLLPDKATMTANEGGNSLIITDTQTSIRRMVEIVKALDTAVSSVSSVKVFPLRYADAKALATVIKDLFAPADTSRNTGQNAGGANRFLNQIRGGGGGGGGFGGGGFTPGGAGGAAGAGAGGGTSGGGRAPTPRVIAVAEERSNAIVVSAPDDQMPVIEDLVRQVDTNVEDVTELRVFRLKYADAQETADLLQNLFSDSTSSSSSIQGGRGQIQFGGRFGGAFGGAAVRTAGAASADSSRLQKQSKVVAVPDLRTGSVVVSAARELMVQIGKMIEDLDADPAKKQQVFVFDVQNTDPQSVQDILQSLFPAPTYGSGSNTRQNSRQQNGVGSQLNNRATQSQNQGSRGGNMGLGTSSGGFGGGSSFGR